MRASGILLHISSLPSAYGIGDFGPGAYAFLDFLSQSHQTYWQILPLNPTDAIYGDSPYSSISAFAGNILFISPEYLVRDGWLSERQITPIPIFPEGKVDYPTVRAYKHSILRKAYDQFRKGRKEEKQFKHFCSEHAWWLDDFALFVALKEHLGGEIFVRWPKEICERQTSAVHHYRETLKEQVEREKFFQFLFYHQWHELKFYCLKKHIKLIGDIPIYVNDDGVDVWTHPTIFKLDEARRPRFVAGVPPDYFSETGQRWGNPVYDWEELEKTHFDWWLKRLEFNFKLYDVVRIDHFRGLIAYWEIPVAEKTAVQGEWVSVPYEKFFKTIKRRFPKGQVIAEDLGIITPDVREAMTKFGFPGMKVLLFAFGDSDLSKHPYIPENYTKSSVVYTGTHDNNTVRGWFEHEARPEEKERFFGYVQRSVSPSEVAGEFIQLAMMSAADTSIIPMQDILGLGREARMNIPGTTNHNWQWRLTPQQLSGGIVKPLVELTKRSKRG